MLGKMGHQLSLFSRQEQRRCETVRRGRLECLKQARRLVHDQRWRFAGRQHTVTGDELHIQDTGKYTSHQLRRYLKAGRRALLLFGNSTRRTLPQMRLPFPDAAASPVARAVRAPVLVDGKYSGNP